jgi:hypothetical protein
VYTGTAAREATCTLGPLRERPRVHWDRCARGHVYTGTAGVSPARAPSGAIGLASHSIQPVVRASLRSATFALRERRRVHWDRGRLARPSTVRCDWSRITLNSTGCSRFTPLRYVRAAREATCTLGPRASRPPEHRQVRLVSHHTQLNRLFALHCALLRSRSLRAGRPRSQWVTSGQRL